MVVKKKRDIEKQLAQPVQDPDAEIITRDDNDVSVNESRLVARMGKFARLKYGNNEELLFNIDCQVQYLIEYFADKCGSLRFVKEDIDLADLDGEVKNINRDKFMLSKLASFYLEPRMIYVLVEVKQTELKNYPNILPLLENSELLTQNFLTKLSPKPPKNQKNPPKANQKSQLNNSQNSNKILNNSETSGRNSSNKVSLSPNSNK